MAKDLSLDYYNTNPNVSVVFAGTIDAVTRDPDEADPDSPTAVKTSPALRFGWSGVAINYWEPNGFPTYIPGVGEYDFDVHGTAMPGADNSEISCIWINGKLVIANHVNIYLDSAVIEGVEDDALWAFSELDE